MNFNVPDVKTDTRLSFKELDEITRVDDSFIPRYYQKEAVDSIFNYFYDGGRGHPLVVASTGAGKSHILGMFCKEVLTRWPDQRILILTHVDTIIKQDYLAVRKHLPPNQVGIYSAGVGRKERKAVTVAGIQSIYQKYSLFSGTTIILIDEAHTVPPKGEGQYRSFLSKFTCPIVGLTATHFRLGSGYLHEGDGRIFTDVIYETDIEKLIEEGFLCNLVAREPDALVDMEGVKTQNGDFSKKETVERLDREGLTESIINDLLQYKDNYKHWLVFAIDIEHAELIALFLNDAGIRTAVVHSKQSKALNNALKDDFCYGMYQALVSVESLTTGFDAPFVDLIALIRPTKSPVLHIQMIGRGLRTHPDKEYCLVLDYAGNVPRLGPINDVHIASRKKKGKGNAITKTCPECKTILPGSVRTCTFCGHEFVFKEKINDEAATDKIIKPKKEKKEVKPAWYQVDSIAYSEYLGKSGLTLQVLYRCGLRSFFEYKQFDFGSKASYHSKYWWKHRAIDNTLDSPVNSREAVIRAQAGDLKEPHAILVLEKGRYPDIQQVVFKENLNE